MGETLKALSGILLKAIPTLLLVVLLHFYFKKMLFGPLERVRKARYEATAGAREAARKAMERAAAKAAEYEQALTAARGDLYKEQEELRRLWRSDQDQAISQARDRAQEAIRKSRGELEADSAAAREQLRSSSEQLADRIASRVLEAPVR